MKLTITAYSTAFFSTGYFIEEYGVALDAGDGPERRRPNLCLSLTKFFSIISSGYLLLTEI